MIDFISENNEISKFRKMVKGKIYKNFILCKDIKYTNFINIWANSRIINLMGIRSGAPYVTVWKKLGCQVSFLNSLSYPFYSPMLRIDIVFRDRSV